MSMDVLFFAFFQISVCVCVRVCVRECVLGELHRLRDSSRRLTFMCGFWAKISARPRGLDQPGPGQPFPDLAQTKYTWYVMSTGSLLLDLVFTSLEFAGSRVSFLPIAACVLLVFVCWCTTGQVRCRYRLI
jgi:hypothetical protein